MKRGFKLRGRLRLHLGWPLWLSILLLPMVMQLYIADRKAGIIGTCYFLAFFLCALIIRYGGHKKMRRDLIHFASTYGQMQMQTMKELSVPFAVLSEEGQLLWGNDEFVRVAVNKKAARRNIANVFPEISENSLPVDGGRKVIHIHAGDKYYRAVLSLVSDDGFNVDDQIMPMDQLLETKQLIAMFLYDETEMIELEERREEENLIVGLLYIDNFDEMLDSIDEVRQSLMTALIDRKINKTMQAIDAICKKIEKDKFLFVFKQKYLQELMNDRFSVLEEIRNINIGNEQTATISIGIGVGKGTFNERYEWARAAIDLALGRGGDQVVIKNGNNITYYGGKTQQMEKNTRVKARVKAQALKEFMSTKDRVVVMGHKITDVDALGAAIGIFRAGKTLGKSVSIVVNDPTKSIRPLIAGYVNNPDYEPSMFVDSEQAKDMVDNNTVVVVVDTNRPSYTECEELLHMTKTIVVLDHHRRGSEVIENAVLSYVEPYASSACEMVAEILQYFSDDLRIRNMEADCLYAGIMIDTNNFTTRAGVRTFEAAAFLRRSGADVTRVRKLLRDDLKSYQARAEAVRTAQIYREYYAIARCPSENLDSPTVIGAQAANELLNIAGVKASFVLTQYNNEVYISARAIDEINVQVMMEKMGGGGHMNIAGAQVKASPDEVERMLKDIIDQEYQEENTK